MICKWTIQNIINWRAISSREKSICSSSEKLRPQPRQEHKERLNGKHCKEGCTEQVKPHPRQGHPIPTSIMFSTVGNYRESAWGAKSHRDGFNHSRWIKHNPRYLDILSFTHSNYFLTHSLTLALKC